MEKPPKKYNKDVLYLGKQNSAEQLQFNSPEGTVVISGKKKIKEFLKDKKLVLP